MDPLSLFLSGGQGGLSLSTPATSSTGPSTIGGFHFAPKSSPLSPFAWAALALGAVVAVVVFTRRR